MNAIANRLEAGGLVPVNSKVDEGATEQIVARCYHHPALGDRPVVRLASDRLGEAEDLAMEFLGFEKPEVSQPLAIQQRRSLGFAAWALINDPKNAALCARTGQTDEGGCAESKVEARACLGCLHGHVQGTGQIGSPFLAALLGRSWSDFQGFGQFHLRGSRADPVDGSRTSSCTRVGSRPPT